MRNINYGGIEKYIKFNKISNNHIMQVTLNNAKVLMMVIMQE